ncbi:MAG: secretion system protein F [Chloroflexi bacterium]|nr:secretion system protein F [Chloroflexota bacterium]
MPALNPMTLLLVGGGIAFLLLVLGAILSVTSSGAKDIEDRLAEYISSEELSELEQVRKTQESLWKQLNRRAERTNWWQRLRRDLIRAGLRLTPFEYILLRIAAFVLGPVLGYILGRGSWLVAGLGLLVGLFGPGWLIRFLQRRRVSQFEAQLVDTLNLMVNGLRAGFSVTQVIESIASEMPPPTSEEFRRVVQETQIGLSLEEALDHLVERVPSEDLELIVTAIKIQQQVGGSLAEILDTISFTIRERIRIKGEIRTLTAQARISGIVLAFMPIALFLIINLISPDYVGEFFNNGICGYSMLGCGLLLIVTGYFLMQKVADIEV